MSPSEAHNPFAMFMDPEVVAKALQASERLGSLHSRVCRPLDRPLPLAQRNNPAADYDAAIDRAAERRG